MKLRNGLSLFRKSESLEAALNGAQRDHGEQLVFDLNQTSDSKR